MKQTVLEISKQNNHHITNTAWRRLQIDIILVFANDLAANERQYKGATQSWDDLVIALRRRMSQEIVSQRANDNGGVGRI